MNRWEMHSSDARGTLVLRDVFCQCQLTFFKDILVYFQILDKLQDLECNVFNINEAQKRASPKRRRKIVKKRG